MSLQLALTQLESMAELLNERKRESEQYQAFRDTLRRVSGKFSLRPLADSNRYLLRQDNVTLVVSLSWDLKRYRQIWTAVLSQVSPTHLFVSLFSIYRNPF